MLFYTQTIFEATGSNIPSALSSIIIGRHGRTEINPPILRSGYDNLRSTLRPLLLPEGPQPGRLLDILAAHGLPGYLHRNIQSWLWPLTLDYNGGIVSNSILFTLTEWYDSSFQVEPLETRGAVGATSRVQGHAFYHVDLILALVMF